MNYYATRHFWTALGGTILIGVPALAISKFTESTETAFFIGYVVGGFLILWHRACRAVYEEERTEEIQRTR